MKILNNKKIATTILATLVIGLVLLSPTTIMPSVNAQSQSSLSYIQHFHPLPPHRIGCYEYTKETSWSAIPCTSQDWIKTHIHSLDEGASHGVIGESNGVGLTYGVTNVTLSTFTAESDTQYGTGAFSIQDNTNDWTSGGSDYAVQFAEVNDLPASWAEICISQNDITAGPPYNVHCAPTDLQSLTSGYVGWVEGYVDTSTSQLTGTFCETYPTFKCKSVVTSDVYGLASNWSSTSGQILGEQTSSEAKFTSPTDEYTIITDTPASTATIYNSTLTQETNNLSYKQDYTSCSGQCIAYTESKN